MQDSIAVANYFINKSLSERIELTPMKLLKLTYLAHGWYLALKGDPLLSENIEAWKHGPVVPSVYRKFRSYGSSQILTPAQNSNGETPSISDIEVMTLLDRVWEVYKSYSGLQLSTITHESNSPWDIAWNQHGGKSVWGKRIDNGTIRQYFQAKLTPA